MPALAGAVARPGSPLADAAFVAAVAAVVVAGVFVPQAGAGFLPPASVSEMIGEQRTRGSGRNLGEQTLIKRFPYKPWPQV